MAMHTYVCRSNSCNINVTHHLIAHSDTCAESHAVFAQKQNPDWAYSLYTHASSQLPLSRLLTV